jgi:hypothetical protein
MVDDTLEEKDFRERYAYELRKKKVRSSVNPNFGLDELSEEVRKVKHQELITPGRRGEQIKHEEINKEILRRLSLEQAEPKS